MHAIESPVVADVRGRGLFIGIESDPRHATDAPPLTIAAADLASCSTL